MHSISKILISLMFLTSCVGGFEQAYEFCYRPYNEMSIYAKNDLEEQKGKLDMLFCGTSIVHNSFQPQVFDEELGVNSFNIASSMQPLSGTYHFLLETLDTNPVETVFLGITPAMLLKDSENIDTETGVFDRMTTLKGKINYLIDSCDEQNYTSLLFYSTRNKAKNFSVFDVDNIIENVSYKLSDNYKQNIPPENCNYVYKGYIAMDKVFSGTLSSREARRAQKEEEKWAKEKIYKKNRKYLDKIIKLCKDREVDLNLVIVPVPNIYLEAMEGGAELMHNYIGEIAEKEKLDFYDFNYYKYNKEEFTDECFRDYYHMNATGAERFSAKLAEIYLADENDEDMDKYFNYQ